MSNSSYAPSPSAPSFSDSLRGNCHCGRYRFWFSTPSLNKPIVCACSLCTKLGALWVRPAADTFHATSDVDLLVEYQGVKFCPTCGTAVVRRHEVGPLKGELLVNARGVWGFNSFGVVVGATEEVSAPAEVDKKFDPVGDPATLPAAKHHGSCHCGKVGVELLVDISELEVKEDNCSSCVRNAYIGVYPTKDQVRIYGKDNTFEYLYGRKFNGAVHCRTCGVLVFNNVYGPPISVFDSLPPERKEKVLSVYWKNMALQPLNVRVLDDFDIGSLKIEKSDEGTEGYSIPE